MIKSTDNKYTLIKFLVDEYDCDKTAIESKTKRELLDMIKELDGNLESAVEDPVEIITEKNINDTVEIPEVKVPTFADYIWHDFVMEKFEKDELVDGCPTVDGMRRIVELLIGEITDITSHVVQTPDQNNERRATVEVIVGIQCFNDRHGGSFRTYSGCADVYYGNADGIYGKHPVALAETRAEGRALKRALRLRKVVSAEEKVGDNTSAELDIKSKDPITDNQKTFIGFACSKERANINVEKFIKTKFPKVKSINEVKYTEAQELVLILDEYNRKQDTIPVEIKGFDSGWLTTFGS